MQNSRPRGLRSRNPFHPLVLGAGVAFAMTACSCVVMHVKKLPAATGARPPVAADQWLVLLDEHCGMILSISLAVLALAALADVVWEYQFGGAGTRDGAAKGGSSEMDKVTARE